MIDPTTPTPEPPAGTAGTAGTVMGQPVSAYVPVMELRAMQVRRDAPGLVRIGIHLLLLVLGGVAIYATRRSPLIVAAWVFQGYVIAHLFALLHECSHRTAFKTPWLNSVTAIVAGYSILQPPLHFRREHVAHHAYTQDLERDPERIPLPATFGQYLLFLSGVPYWWYILSGLGAHCMGRLRPGEEVFLRTRAERTTVFREARLIVLVYVVAIVASLVAGSDAFFVYWLIPRVIGEPVMRAYRMAEHAGRPLVREVTQNTRTFTTPGFVRWLDYNMNFHAEHHAAPAVPFHALPRLHDRYGRYVGWREGGFVAAHRDILRQVRRGASSRAAAPGASSSV